MSKSLCNWSKEDLKAKRLLKVLNQPQFFCKECGRAANKKKYLCEPRKLYKNLTN